MKISAKVYLTLLLAAVPWRTKAIELDVTSAASIQNATSIVAYDLMKYYTGNVTNTPSTIAVLPSPYYWWEAGAMWGAMLDYYHYTNDSTYNDNTYQALISQVGPNYDYMVPAQQTDEGNDDQAFWGFATMSAAERDFTPPPHGTPSWLQLTINLWNTQAARWDLSSCGGGLKWQIFTFNHGYDYKNSVSNGAFFQLSARLARYTGNSTYLDWAVKTWDWSTAVGLVDGSYNVYDGTNDTMNCSQISNLQWTYSLGIYLYGAAVLYNYTNGSALWEERTQGLLKATSTFFSPYDNATDIMSEVACEQISTCNNDQWSFKAYLSRFMWASTQMASFSYPTISTLLTKSSQAAAQACSGGASGTTCGAKWYVSGWDGGAGVGQQLSALEIMQGLLINSAQAPFVSGDMHVSAASTVAVSTVEASAISTSSVVTSSVSSSTIAPTSITLSTIAPTSIALNTIAPTSIAPSTAAPSNTASDSAGTVATSSIAASSEAPTTGVTSTGAVSTGISGTVAASTQAPSTGISSSAEASTEAPSNVAASIVAGSTVAASIIATSSVPASNAASNVSVSTLAATLVALSTVAVSTVAASSIAGSSAASSNIAPSNVAASSGAATSSVAVSNEATSTAAATPTQVFNSASSCKRRQHSRRAAAAAGAIAIGASLHVYI